MLETCPLFFFLDGLGCISSSEVGCGNVAGGEIGASGVWGLVLSPGTASGEHRNLGSIPGAPFWDT